MIADIINGIAVSLDFAFPNYEIYTDSVSQGLKEPCFQIVPQQCFRNPAGPSGLRSCVNPFDILYFPVDERDLDGMMNTGELMADAIECITLANGDVLRATGVQLGITDGVLHLFCNFNHHEMVEAESDYMETMDDLEVAVNGN